MDLSAVGNSLPEIGVSKKVCAVCQAPADKSCSACHQIDYCSVEHQKSHWKEHKKACSPIRIVSSPELGPHFVATRDLPPWSLLLTELPVLVNPFSNSKYAPLSCISCLSILTSAPWPCSQCSTTSFCNLACSKNKIHTEFECGILSKCSKDQRGKLCIHPNLGYLRAIHLKNKDAQTWAKVLNLRGADQYKPGDEDENDKWFIREILPLVGEKGVLFEADMAKLKGIYQQKGIVVVVTPTSPKGVHGESELLYLKSSNFAQNCFPNCTLKIGKDPSFHLEIRTTVEVKKGTIPSIDFKRSSYAKGAMLLQHMIHYSKGALCICPRCTDPTGSELGTMMSAVRCPQPICKDGYLLPIDPMDMAMNAPWRCNRSGYKGEGCTWAEIAKLTIRLTLDIGIFEERVSMADFDRISEFLESLKKKLHPNHYIVIKFECMAAELLNSQLGSGIKFSVPRMDLHISIGEHLLKMIEMSNLGLINPIRENTLTLIFNGLNHRLLWDWDQQAGPSMSAVQRKLIERTIEVIDQHQAFIKLNPDMWTPRKIQFQMERRRVLQMALNSTN